MGKFLRWFSASALVAAGLWELGESSPSLSPILVGILLLGLGVLIGLRIGSNSVLRFVSEMKRMNKFVTEQNRQLAELNLKYLKDRTAESSVPLEESETDE